MNNAQPFSEVSVYKCVPYLHKQLPLTKQNLEHSSVSNSSPNTQVEFGANILAQV